MVVGSMAERRLRASCEQLKLALAEATVQLRIWQKGAEHIDEVLSPTLEVLRATHWVSVSSSPSSSGSRNAPTGGWRGIARVTG
jgi:hypothetical protein